MAKKKAAKVREAASVSKATSETAVAARRGGRKPTPIDAEVVRNAAAIQCTQDEIGALFGIRGRQFHDRMKADPALREAYDIGSSSGRASLRRLQFKIANSARQDAGRMAIWLGKQYLGQRDRMDVAFEDLRRRLASMSEGELKERADSLIGMMHAETETEPAVH